MIKKYIKSIVREVIDSSIDWRFQWLESEMNKMLEKQKKKREKRKLKIKEEKYKKSLFGAGDEVEIHKVGEKIHRTKIIGVIHNIGYFSDESYPIYRVMNADGYLIEVHRNELELVRRFGEDDTTPNQNSIKKNY